MDETTWSITKWIDRCHTTFNKAMNSKNQGGIHIRSLDIIGQIKPHLFNFTKGNFHFIDNIWKVCFTVSHIEFFINSSSVLNF